MDFIEKKILIGAMCLFLLSMLFPADTFKFIVDASFGIAISTLFLTPLLSYITGKGGKYLPYTLGVGLILFVVYLVVELKGDVSKGLQFILEWMFATTIISAVVRYAYHKFMEISSSEL